MSRPDKCERIGTMKTNAAVNLFPQPDYHKMDWKAEYATGIRNIDHQHAQILQIITLFELLSGDKARWHEVHSLILRTREFMEFHFSVEESLMRLLSYTDGAAHRAEHQLELKQFADIERGILTGTIHGSLAARIRDCLFGHVIAGDKRFAQYALSLFGRRSPGQGKDRPGGAAMRRE